MNETKDRFALDVEAPQLTAAELSLCKNVAESLNKHYPGHLWAVATPPNTGVVQVRDLSLSGEWGFMIRIPEIYSVSELDKMCMRYGGELLERYRVSRSRANQEQLAALKTDFSGRHIIQA